MQRRKIQINQLKKKVCKGRKVRTIKVKYETVLDYFKQKQYKDLPVFSVSFMPLINDLLAQLAATELIAKLQSESKESIKQLPHFSTTLKLQSFDLRVLSKQYHIQELCTCLYIQGNDKRVLNIQRSKLMNFYKHIMRIMYPNLSDREGQKMIIEDSQFKILYEQFLLHWNKSEQKGKINCVQKIQRKLIRSLYFLGVLIQNNILETIEMAERRKKESNSQFGTKSQDKRRLKGFNQQVSTVHSQNNSLNPSSISLRLKSQASQEQIYPIGNNLSRESQYSGKSQRIISKTRFNVWDKAQIHNLCFHINNEPVQANAEEQNQQMQINLLSNDVQNILIERAFKIQKFTDPCYRNVPVSPYQYGFVDYSQAQQQQYHYDNYYFSNMMPYPYAQPNYPQYFPTYSPSGDITQLNQLKRSLNLVQTRKTDMNRYQ